MTTELTKESNSVDRIMQKNAERLQQQGLNVAEVKTKVNALVAGLDNKDLVASLGSNASTKIIAYSEKLLSQVKAKDLDVGEKLNEVVLLAKNINVSNIVDGKSKIPLIGGLLARFGNTKEKVLGKYESLSTQINKLMGDINASQSRLSDRVRDLETLYEYNVNEYHELDLFIMAGEAKQDELNQELNQRKLLVDSNSMEAQEISDLQDVHDRLGKRIGDLKTMQVVAVQTAPMIRMIQSNNRSLVDKFRNLKELTVPSWQKQFTLAIALMEQRKAVELTQKIDDTTNDLLKANAALLKQNSIHTAQANQRGVVDIETLEEVQRTLIETVQEVQNIQREGEANRRQAQVRMEAMKNDLVKQLSHQQ